MGTIDNIILNIMDLMICTRRQLTAIETLNRIFFVYNNVEQFKCRTVSNVQTVRTNYLETYMAIFGRRDDANDTRSCTRI